MCKCRCDETLEEQISYLHDPMEHQVAWNEHVGQGGHHAKCWTPPAVWPPVYPSEDFPEERQEIRDLKESVVVTSAGKKATLRADIREAEKRLEDLEQARITSKAARTISWEKV